MTAGAGALAGVAVAIVVVALVAGAAGAGNRPPPSERDPRATLDASHTPPLLTAPGEKVELRYDIYCPPPRGDADDGIPCDAGGTVYVRAGDGRFEAIPLRLDPGADEGRYVAAVPDAIAHAAGGFSYYAVLRNEATGTAMTLPSGGSVAPQTSMTLARTTTVRLPPHRFGATRPADARVAEAGWGEGPADVGLEGGRQATPIGASSFDVGDDGTVTVLDEVHRRVLRWASAQPAPVAVPLPGVAGTIADLAAAADGKLYVLETAGDAAGNPVLRAFESDGTPVGGTRTAERTAAAVRSGPAGPVTLQYPSGQWMPVATGGAFLKAGRQRGEAQPGVPFPGGREVVVLRTGDEIRLAIVVDGRIARSWRVVTDTSVAEVQLAEPVGEGLLVVFRTYTEGHDEFVALSLGAGGVVEQFALDSADWAETAPLGRFRLAAGALYQLGSNPEGIFVDRFNLEVTS